MKRAKTRATNESARRDEKKNKRNKYRAALERRQLDDRIREAADAGQSIQTIASELGCPQTRVKEVTGLPTIQDQTKDVKHPKILELYRQKCLQRDQQPARNGKRRKRLPSRKDFLKDLQQIPDLHVSKKELDKLLEGFQYEPDIPHESQVDTLKPDQINDVKYPKILELYRQKCLQRDREPGHERLKRLLYSRKRFLRDLQQIPDLQVTKKELDKLLEGFQYEPDIPRQPVDPPPPKLAHTTPLPQLRQHMSTTLMQQYVTQAIRQGQSERDIFRAFIQNNVAVPLDIILGLLRQARNTLTTTTTTTTTPAQPSSSSVLPRLSADMSAGVPESHKL